MGVGVWKTIRKLNAIWILIFEKKRKIQTIWSSFSFQVAVHILIVYFAATSSPFWTLTKFSVTYLHSLVIETSAFCKTFYCKFYLSFQPLAGKIKPSRYSIRTCLSLQSHLVVMRWQFPDFIDVAWLKVASEDGITDANDFSTVTMKSFLFISFLQLCGQVKGIFGLWYNFQLLLFIGFGHIVFSGVVEVVSCLGCQRISQILLFELLKLIISFFVLH